jgi:ABC-type dipeptide transport system, periplasmic component
MIADLRQGNLDWIDQVPFNAVNAVKKSKGVKVNEWPGAEITNITWNSNPRKLKNRELLDPRVKKALSMCVDRDKMIQVVFSGYASKVESLVGTISPLENPNLGPTKYNCAAANKALDALGYKRGSNGIRVAPATTGKYAQDAHPMRYDIVTPTSTDFNVDRMAEIVKEGFAKLGVKGTQKVGGDSTAAYAIETDRSATREEHRLLEVRHRDVGLDRVSGPGLPALGGHEGPVVLLERHGLGQPRLRSSLPEAGRTVNPRSGGPSSTRCRRWCTTPFVYTQLTNHVALDATSTKWTGFKNQLNAYAKTYYTNPRKVR